MCKLKLILPVLVMCLGVWLTTGTMAPYAASHYTPRVTEPCRYLVSIDHPHFELTYKFLDGEPKEVWAPSVMLRRITYPIAAYPLMKLFGFEEGGVICNIIFLLISVTIFLKFIHRRFGERSAATAAWLLSTYPGICYWGTLPYSHAMIVPTCLMLVAFLEDLRADYPWSRFILWSLVIGLCFIAYDLLPILGVASLFWIFLRSGVVRAIVAAILFVAPGVISSLALAKVFDVPLENSNTVTYKNIVMSYFSNPNFADWWPLIAAIPQIFINNFLFSNFLVLPLTFCAFWLIFRPTTKVKISHFELLIFLNALLIFLFNNVAPPYQGWSMRGEWIARLYQPIFVVFVLYISRCLGTADKNSLKNKAAVIVCSFAVFANGAIVFGPILGQSQFADYTYFYFYQHGKRGAYTENMSKYGARPLGFCGTSEPLSSKAEITNK